MPLRLSYPIKGYISVLLLSLFVQAISQAAPMERNLRGIPYYHFFTSHDFDSSASSVFITTAEDGTTFYGDRNWIFQYDGTSWHKVYQNSNSNEKITSLLWDPDGVVYAGGFNRFGTFTVDENNETAFRSLLPKDSFRNGEGVEKIESTPQSVYLTGRRSFACYDKASGSMDLHVLSTWVTATFFMDGVIHLLTDDNVILRYQNKELTELPEVSALLNQRGITVADIVIDFNGDAIMASERKGIFRFDGDSLTPAYPNFKYSSDNLTTDIEQIPQDRLIVASLGGGITVLDEEGNAIETLGPQTDYRFKSARAVNVDQSGAVWAMFNNTLAKILLDSPLTAIDERIRPSFFYASQHIHQDELYVRSFYVLYKAIFDETGRISHFVNALENSELEVWSVAQTDDHLYLNTANHGIFLYEDRSTTFLIESEAYDRFEHSKVRPQYLLGANSDSIALYKKSGNALTLLDKIENPEGFINRLHEDRKGDFWIEYGLGQTAQVKIAGERLELKLFGEDYGLPPDEWGSLWIHNGIPHLNTNSETLVLDASQKPFQVDTELQNIIETEKFGIGRAFTDPEGNLWVSANNKNLIFWKQPDGSYLRDETALSEMGEPYFESIEFLDNGDALIMTSFEFFHFRHTKPDFLEQQEDRTTQILRISDPKNEDTHFSRLGNQTQPNRINLTFQQNNLEFTVSNSFTYSTQPPQFQFKLDGFSDESLLQDELPWNKSSSITYTNLEPGKYTFKTRTRLGNGNIGPWTEFAFAVQPPPYRTFSAYLLYLSVALFLILSLVKFNSSRLRKQNFELERNVRNRTQEIGAKNSELEQQAKLLESKNVELESQSAELKRNADELSTALKQLRSTQDELLSTARIAGRAEVATNVLHNVGNVLNSVNIGLSNLDKQLQKSRARNLKSIVQLIKENEGDLAHYLERDERGKQIPAYLDQLAKALNKELESNSQRIREIDENVDHIKNVIATQQTHAKKIGMEQEVRIAELLESALAVTLGDSYESSFPIEREYDWDLVTATDKHLVLDVVINLIKNAKESLSHLPPQERLLTLRCLAQAPSSILITITDNGLGIDKSTQSKLFTHGFTTKPEGHGFGLHGSANAIKSLGGELKLESDGLNKGATATIRLPT